jgi:hypothetical protein
VGRGWLVGLAQAEATYDPYSPGWTSAGQMGTARYLAVLAILSPGQALVIGGYDGANYLSSSDLYNPASRSWAANAAMSKARQNHTATPLPNGTVLVAGGYNATDGWIASCDLYTPGWDGMAYLNDGVLPPDPHGAAGPYGIIQTVNKRFAYFTKAGTKLWEADLVSLFGATGFTADPKVIFDVAQGSNGNFFVIMEENHQSGPNCYSGSSTSYCNMAVSINANPSDGTPNSWYIYKFDITEVVGSQNYAGDYPGFGIDTQAVYVTYCMFRLYDNSYPYCLDAEPCSTVTAYNSQIIAFKKSDLTSHAGSPFRNRLYTTPTGQNNGFALQPASPAGGNPGDMAFFAEVPVGLSLPIPPTTSVRVWQLNHPLSGSPTLTGKTASIASNLGGQNCYQGAPQPGGSSFPKLSTVEGNRTISALWNNNLVWFSSTAGGTSRALPYWYRVDVSNFGNGITATSGSIDPGLDGNGNPIWGFYPILGSNSRGDICMVFSVCSSGMNPAIAYTWRTSTDSLTPAFRQVQILKLSSSGMSNGGGGGSERWGDFGAVSADPLDNTFWVSHEYVQSTSSHDWGTWWNNVYVP